MEKQEPENSRLASKVKVGSRIKWTGTEIEVKLEVSNEISKYNKCYIEKGWGPRPHGISKILN